MIRFEQVTKKYPHSRRHSLRNIELHIDRGEMVFIVGPSGAGKSTLLKLLYREELPSSGRVIVDRKDLATLRPWQVPYYRRRLGIIFQDFKLLSDLTVYDNVAFALECTGVPPREIRRRVPAALELVGIRHKSRNLASELSGGEQQRVAVARAIVRNPVLVLADEPTGNLDPENSRAIMQLLLQINQIGTTVIVATHEQHLVDEFRQRVIALENGQIVRDEPHGGYTADAWAVSSD